MKKIGVIGAGTMGHGIAQVCASAGFQVFMTDHSEEALEAGLLHVGENLEMGVKRGKVTLEQREATLASLRGTMVIEEVCDEADLIIEAIPERLALKQALLQTLERHAPERCLFGTNTSSLSIGTLADVVARPERVIGTHFFNPVHIMKLLEVIVHKHTTDEVFGQIEQFGQSIGKQVIRVQDVPGFATSRLGVCLGMEAIRMVEQGVASTEDIDTAMVLGYRHPIGPLKLTDLVGLDVRMAIGEYLSQELNNPAFEPPALMRQMVAEGKLGKKSGQGFYTW